MLMVGAKVLFNSAKMLKMGVLVVLMHNHRDQRDRESKQTILPLISPRETAGSQVFRGCREVSTQ